MIVKEWVRIRDREKERKGDVNGNKLNTDWSMTENKCIQWEVQEREREWKRVKESERE